MRVSAASAKPEASPDPPANSFIRWSTAFRPLLREGDSCRLSPSWLNQSGKSTWRNSSADKPLTRASSNATRPRISRASLLAANCQ
jgi:hypothetical protein